MKATNDLFDMAELQQLLRERFNEKDLQTEQGWVRITCQPSSVLAAWAAEVVSDFIQEYIDGGVI